MSKESAFYNDPYRRAKMQKKARWIKVELEMLKKLVDRREKELLGIKAALSPCPWRMKK